MGEPFTSENTAEFLRLTLPLMSKHGVPVTPRNYAVWFEHVSGQNEDLSGAIEAISAKNEPFTESICDDLYQQFVSSCDITQFQNIRSEMQSVVNEIGEELSLAAKSSAQYGGTLDNVARDIEKSSSLNDIRSMLHTLVAETRQMKESTDALQSHFDRKSDEIQLLREQLEEERKKAATDPLTGLPNRATLFDALTETAEDPSSGTLSLLMVDIDHFKQVNDKFGHLIGDRVIRFVASVLTQQTKGCDTPARFGGEEFAIVLPNTGIDGAKAVAQNIRRTIEEAKLVRSETKEPLGQVTVSIGVGVYRPVEDIMELIDRADRALYASKQNGRNRVTLESEL